MNLATRLLMMGASGSGSAPTYVEDVFSTWLYTGNGSTQTITNGIDLSGKGGLVWIKYRSGSLSGIQHNLYDTSRGTNKFIDSGATHGNITTTDTLTAFNSSGFTLGADVTYGTVNYNSSQNYASWTFRKAAKFFDVVTYTGTGSARTIAHNLGSTPGCVVIKKTSTTGNWIVYHRSVGATGGLQLNNTFAVDTNSALFNNTSPTSTVFTVGTDSDTNANGATYVAYLFAHDAGGFGDSGNDSVVKCGSFTSNGSGNATVTLGWEPQWFLLKRSDSTGDWFLLDNMRGMPVGSNARQLFPNLSNSESNFGWASPLPNGIDFPNGNLDVSATYIYIAIRRGPMKTPTDATKVFSVSKYTGTSANLTIGSVTTDLAIVTNPPASVTGTKNFRARLTGRTLGLSSTNTNAEVNLGSDSLYFDKNDGLALGPDLSIGYTNNSGISYTAYMLRRAPGFFDVVAYTGDGVDNRSLTHNLTVTPELIIAKCRNDARFWPVYVSAGGTGNGLYLDLNGGYYGGRFTGVSPTTFSVSADETTNNSGFNYIAYLFATCPGVSKVGNYTGTGTTLNVDCGFTNGARFVLIKRTDSTGDWFVWDTARGIVSGNDPYLLLNSTAAEVTNTDYIDPLSSGFQISSTAPAAINASGGSFIFLAIA